MTTGDPRIRVDADFLFEVDPKSQVFDVIRERVNDAVEDEYGDLVAVDDFRASLQTNSVELEPTSWHVDATVGRNGSELHVDIFLDADGKAEAALVEYVEDEVDDRFDIDADRLRYKKIRICPGGWFVDAVYEGE